MRLLNGGLIVLPTQRACGVSFKPLGPLVPYRFGQLLASVSDPGEPPGSPIVEPSARGEAASLTPSVCDVLVVDDDLTILYTIAEALELEGYNVEIANNGAEALAGLQSFRPRVVLLDLRMPVLDGWAFMEQVRQTEITFKLILMTATPDVENWAEEVGAAAYLRKPFELEELIALVAELCGGGEGQRTESGD
jgi:CheY-like chemotaxis protein